MQTITGIFYSELRLQFLNIGLRFRGRLRRVGADQTEALPRAGNSDGWFKKQAKIANLPKKSYLYGEFIRQPCFRGFFGIFSGRPEVFGGDFGIISEVLSGDFRGFFDAISGKNFLEKGYSEHQRQPRKEWKNSTTEWQKRKKQNKK